MTEDHTNEDAKKLSYFETKYQDQLTQLGATFSELMRKKAEFYKAISKEGFTSEEIENMFPPELRGTYEDILDNMLPESARRRK